MTFLFFLTKEIDPKEICPSGPIGEAVCGDEGKEKGEGKEWRKGRGGRRRSVWEGGEEGIT